MASSVTTIGATLKRLQNRTHHGWANLAVAALAMVATLPGRTQGLGLITEPLMAGLAIDRVSYAQVNFWATLIGAAFCLPCGRLTDRFGSRIVLTTVAAALGVTVIAMSQISGLVGLALAVTLTRGFGQSALSVVSLALVGKWFASRPGVAMGVYSLLVGLGFILAFPTVGQAVLTFGWRNTWLGVGIALLAFVTPIAWLVTRSGPEETGRTGGLPEQTATQRVDIPFSDALQTPAFWVFALAGSMFGLVYSGIALFNQSILEQRGFDAKIYHTVLVVSTFIGLGANFGGGWLASKWSIQKLTGIGMGVLAASLLMLPFVSTFAHVMAYASAMGVAGGVVTVVFFSVWAQVFGRSDLGRIQGVAQMMTVLASAIGPLLLAETLRSTGSYALIFLILAAVVAALGLASWRVPLPARRPMPQSVA